MREDNGHGVVVRCLLYLSPILDSDGIDMSPHYSDLITSGI